MHFTITDNKGADIIILSSDKKEFYIHKCNLIFGSKTFSDMLALPKEVDVASSGTGTGGLPSVSLTEASESVEDMLPYFYPYLDSDRFLHNRDPLTVERIFKAIQFADKYDMNQLVKDWLDHTMYYLSKPFLKDPSAVNSKKFYCFFQPGCPASLDDLKQQLFWKMATTVPISEVEAVTAAFALHDRMQFLAYHRQRIALQMVKKQQNYVNSKTCGQATCSNKRYGAFLDTLSTKQTILRSEDLSLERMLGANNLCNKCKLQVEESLKELRVLIWLP